MPRSQAWLWHARISGDRSTAYWETMIQFSWFPNLKTWESEYCSTNARSFRAEMKRNSSRRILHPAVAYARSLPPSRTCRLRCLSQWPYPRRPDLPARFYSDHAWFGSAETYGLGVMAIWRYDWLHLGWSGMRCRSGPL